MKKILILSLSVLALSGGFAPSFAQDDSLSEKNTYDPQYQGWVNQTAEGIRAAQRASLTDKGFIVPDTVQITLVHHDYMTEDQFGIQMSVPDMVSGCFTLTPLEYQADFTPPHYLDIKVKQYRRIAPEGSTATQKCDAQNKMSSSLVVLSKDDLKEKGTQEIRFSTPAGTDNYKIVITDDRLELIPRSMMVFKGQGMAGPLKDRIMYSFANDKMITLQVPMAKPGEDLTDEIILFAKTRALTPTNPDSPATWSGDGTATYYFYDDNGHILEQIGDNGYAEIGQIAVNRPYDGPEGRTTTPVPLSVFVTRPGTQL